MSNQRYESYYEIHESYKTITQTLEKIQAYSSGIEDFFSNASKESDLLFIACGSSYWMSLSAAKTLQYHTGRRAVAVKAGDVVMAPEEHRHSYKNPVIIAPSRSGRSKELLDAISILKQQYPNLKLFSITAYEENLLASLSDYNISIPWANEVSVCQTRTFNSLWVSFIGITSILTKNCGLTASLNDYLSHAPILYKEAAEKIKQIAAGPIDSLVALGCGRIYGIVIEGAYIVIEMAEMTATYYQLLEYRHGPIVTAGKNLLACVCGFNETTAQAENQMISEIKQQGAGALLVTDKYRGGCHDYIFELGKNYPPEIISLYYIFIMQSLAYHLSIQRGGDPDNPGELPRYIS